MEAGGWRALEYILIALPVNFYFRIFNTAIFILCVSSFKNSTYFSKQLKMGYWRKSAETFQAQFNKPHKSGCLMSLQLERKSILLCSCMIDFGILPEKIKWWKLGWHERIFFYTIPCLFPFLCNNSTEESAINESWSWKIAWFSELTQPHCQTISFSTVKSFIYAHILWKQVNANKSP